MPPKPPNNLKAVWYHPRDDKSDRLLYYDIESRQAKHNEQKLLEPHPKASSDPNYEGLVFLHREPAKDGAFARDWYGPESLVDDRIRVSNAGAGYQSGMLYARGSEPPTLDPRVEVKGQEVDNLTFSWSYDSHPETGDPVDLVELTATSGTLNGDEVYIEVSDAGGIPIDPGTHIIVRHTASNKIQISVPYDSGAVSTGSVVGVSYEACYILDGYSDTESAPGVLADKFHLRTFSYRLGTPSYSYHWDESLGLKLFKETRAVPSTWARKWELGFPTAAISDDESSVGYQPLSKLVTSRVKSGVEGNDTPSEDGISWVGTTRLSIPTICTDVRIGRSYATAEDDLHEYLSVAEDWGAAIDSWGPGQVGATTITYRRICKTSEINTVRSDFLSTLAGSSYPSPLPGPIVSGGTGTVFTFQPETYSILTGTFAAHGGENIWAKASVRPFNLGPFLVKNGQITVTVPNRLAGLGGNTGEGTGLDTGSVYLYSQDPPWGSPVLWEQTTTKARFGYWILDFVCVILPADPS